MRYDLKTCSAHNLWVKENSHFFNALNISSDITLGDLLD